MNGQGRPICTPALRRQVPQIRPGFVRLLCCALLTLSCSLFSPQQLTAQTSFSPIQTSKVRVQIAWVCQTPQPWRGTIRLTHGQFSNMRLLGLDPDQPGSFIQQDDNQQIKVDPRFTNRYSGIEVTVDATLDDILEVELFRDQDPATKRRILQVSLRDLIQGNEKTLLLATNQKLRVARAAGDKLQVQLDTDNMVFAPAEVMRLDIMPTGLAAKPGATLRAKFRLRRTKNPNYEQESKPSLATLSLDEMAGFLGQGDEDLWTRNDTLKVDEFGETPPITNIEIPLPSEEGVYELAIELVPLHLGVTLPQRAPLAARKIQFVIIDPQQSPLHGEGEGTLVSEFNPADPKPFNLLTRLPHASRGPWFNHEPKPWRHQDALWTRVTSGGWVAYSLPVGDANAPHLLDIELPPNYAQNVTISVLDRNGAGELVPIGLDSGVTVGDIDLTLPGISQPSETTRHRLVFWPRTTAPVVLIGNPQTARDIAFGRVRLEAFKQGLPTTTSSDPTTRKRFATIDRPAFKQTFFASNAVDDMGNFGFDDWNTFYSGATRLIAYLRYAGYDGVTMNVASDGASLFPSQRLQPTPKYDRGVYASSAQDPIQKDVVEMLMRLFDREGLAFIPSLEFTAPLPELEKQLATDHSAARSANEGIELVSARGMRGSEMPTKVRGALPYYNPLDARVQTAIQDVLEEFLDRYAKHSAFGGINLILSPNSYTQLPDYDWPYDARSLGDFASDATAAGFESPLEQLAKAVQSAPHSAPSLATDANAKLNEYWLSWRANRLTQFYQELAKSVQNGSGTQLFLSTARLAESSPWQRHLRPSLPQQNSVPRAMLEQGIDYTTLSQHNALTLLHPYRLAPLNHLRSQAINLRVAEAEVQSHFASAKPAVQFLYESQSWQAEGFATSGPFGSGGRLSSEFSGAGAEARQPYAASLAKHDDRLIFSGGRSIAMGQEHASKSFFAVFRQIPDRAFEMVNWPKNKDAPSIASPAPVVVRISKDENETFVYFVNNSPWTARSLLDWSADDNTTVDVLGASDFKPNKHLNGQYGQLVLEPYGLAALRFSNTSVKLLGCRTELPTGVDKQLLDQFNEITARAAQITERSTIELLRDPGFEQSLSNEPDAAWQASEGPGNSVTIDFDTKAAGQAALHLKAVSSRAVVTSHTFDAPATGRLLVSLKLRTAAGTENVAFRCQLLTSNPKYVPEADLSSKQLNTEFREFLLPFSDIPSDPNLQMKLKLEVFGPGEVWIDDIKLHDKWFEKEERDELQRILYVAHRRQSRGDMAACFEQLSGYWPRFLLRHIPPVQVASRPQPEAKRKKQSSSRFFDMRRFLQKRKY